MINNEKKQEIAGFIGYYGLANWWAAAFSEPERRYIQKRYDSSLAVGGLSLTQGEVMRAKQNAVSFLIELSRWFGRAADRHLASAMLEKAESYIDENTKIRDVHILYSMMIDLASREKDPAPEMLDKMVGLCENHIFIAGEIAQDLEKYGPLPKHQGFLHLATIREQEKNYKEAMSLCQEAQDQGWAGDWGQRIKNCLRKLDDSMIAGHGFTHTLSAAAA